MFSSVLCFSQNTEKAVVYFGFNQYSLDITSKDKLDSLIKNCKLKYVNIEAHCDTVGSLAYNDTLSLKRALEIKRYFISQGIEDSLIQTIAMGERFPLSINDSEKVESYNRCAVIYFTSQFLTQITTNTNQFLDTTIIDIDKLEIGSTFILKNLNFKRAKTVLISGSIQTLLTLLKTMMKYPTLEIEIQGYVCCVNEGTDGYDQETNTWDLSERRAKLVYDFLIEHGISSKRLTYKGYGGSNKIIKDEKTEADRAVNRRVEIKITKK